MNHCVSVSRKVQVFHYLPQIWTLLLPINEGTFLIHVPVVVSIPACHAGDRGSIPRRGARWNCNKPARLLALNYNTTNQIKRKRFIGVGVLGTKSVETRTFVLHITKHWHAVWPGNTSFQEYPRGYSPLYTSATSPLGKVFFFALDRPPMWAHRRGLLHLKYQTSKQKRFETLSVSFNPHS